MKIRTLIVDDEPLARDRLRHLLQDDPDIELVGECADGREAVAAMGRTLPELIFLDVQLPELDGFGVLAAVGTGPMPVIVFVTAHEQFALRAFEVHAVDYLLKPFDRERFQKALRRAIERVRNRDPGAIRQRQLGLFADLQSSQLAVKSGGHVVWVKLDDIDWIGSADNYAELHVGAKSHLLRETLGALETRLAPEKFVRISRSAIVNAQRIKELHRLFYGGYELILKDGTQLTVSRRHRHKLKQFGLG
ncbi:MAG: LytTR family DNA-binding domain-containing protein [Verrucomicrobiia bacterium]